jgi:hypothetical protein
MLPREEEFYETASRELAENKLSEAIWAKAFSLSVADEQKAKALYIRLRVEQLERESSRSTAEVIQEAWPAITTGQAFVCPFCRADTTARHECWISSRPDRYYCQACKKELIAEASQAQSTFAVNAGAQLYGKRFPPVEHEEKRNNPMGATGFVLGIVSIFLYFIGILPISAIVFSAIGLGTFKEELQKNKWMAGVGLALGIIYTLMYMRAYGHLE